MPPKEQQNKSIVDSGVIALNLHKGAVYNSAFKLEYKWNIAYCESKYRPCVQTIKIFPFFYKVHRDQSVSYHFKLTCYFKSTLLKTQFSLVIVYLLVFLYFLTNEAGNCCDD